MTTEQSAGGDTDPVGLSWLVTVRWTTVLAAVAAVVVGQRVLDTPISTLPVVVISLLVASNVWLTVQVRHRRTQQLTSIAGVMICADTVLLSGLLMQAGGVLNPASVFYLVQIVVAALVLGRLWTGAVTVLCVIGYALLFVAPPAGLQAVQGMHPEIALHMRGMWLTFVVTAVIIGVLVTRFAVAVERRDHALANLRERGARSARLASLATAVAGAAHELGTPLATMTVAAHELERVLGGLADAAGALDDVRLIRTEIGRCRDVLDGMAGRIAAPMGEAPSATTVDRILAQAVAILPERDRLAVRTIAVPGLAVEWPASVISRALANLLTNAVHAASAASAPSVVLEAAKRDVDRVVLSVTDHGSGIAEETLARVGEPFFSTKTPGGGMGLGVFMTRSIVEQLGGTFEMTSRPGVGTVVTVVLPTRSVAA